MNKEATKQFDPDLSPQSEHNRDAATAAGLSYNKKKEFYEDKDGSLVRDKFGQPL